MNRADRDSYRRLRDLDALKPWSETPKTMVWDPSNVGLRRTNVGLRRTNVGLRPMFAWWDIFSVELIEISGVSIGISGTTKLNPNCYIGDLNNLFCCIYSLQNHQIIPSQMTLTSFNFIFSTFLQIFTALKIHLKKIPALLRLLTVVFKEIFSKEVVFVE